MLKLVFLVVHLEPFDGWHSSDVCGYQIIVGRYS